jgi:hypothetical protein
MREAIRRGLRYYDSLSGGEPYKLRWGSQQKQYWYLRVARPRTQGAYLLGLSHVAREIFSAGPVWAVLRNMVGA